MKKSINLERMIKVCDSAINIEQLKSELRYWVCRYFPSKILIDIEKNKKYHKYITKIYISKRDFETKNPNMYYK